MDIKHETIIKGRERGNFIIRKKQRENKQEIIIKGCGEREITSFDKKRREVVEQLHRKNARGT